MAASAQPARFFFKNSGLVKMHLHLHLGLHKTASSHLQTLLQMSSGRFPESTEYIPNPIVRQNLTFEYNAKKACAFFESVASLDAKNIIISEENICGHSYGFFHNTEFYADLEKHLDRLDFLNDMFDTIDIWVSIRDQATFIPSIYCEALRWGKFQGLDKLLAGNFHQSWVPVIKTISSAFEKARVRVLLYENYHENLPELFEALTGCPYEAELSPQQTINHSLNAMSVRLAARCNALLPFSLPPAAVTGLHTLTRDFSRGKYSPFTSPQQDLLRQLYQQDKTELKRQSNSEIFGRGW